ncbi:MAG: YbhB/YbcL family Raf kinase inhibitor-like protein [Candidatus Yonathbacteria bacterium]|nr:YbhB/YbcL family Raf kinase inhibitor-like protein [Candidatus Yonathbacteria bacterium]
MEITSPAFVHNTHIPTLYTCDGKDSNPPLVFSNIPEHAISLVLIMDDPDVPKELREDGVWDHWIVFDMPPDTREIEEGTEPEGIHGIGTSNNLKYHGPCPPDREHRYIFTLYALDTMLGLPEGATKREVLEAMEGHVIEKAVFIGRYERPRATT